MSYNGIFGDNALGIFGEEWSSGAHLVAPAGFGAITGARRVAALPVAASRMSRQPARSIKFRGRTIQALSDEQLLAQIPVRETAGCDRHAVYGQGIFPAWSHFAARSAAFHSERFLSGFMWSSPSDMPPREQWGQLPVADCPAVDGWIGGLMGLLAAFVDSGADVDCLRLSVMTPVERMLAPSRIYHLMQAMVTHAALVERLRNTGVKEFVPRTTYCGSGPDPVRYGTGSGTLQAQLSKDIAGHLAAGLMQKFRVAVSYNDDRYGKKSMAAARLRIGLPEIDWRDVGSIVPSANEIQSIMNMLAPSYPYFPSLVSRGPASGFGVCCGW